MLFGNTRAVLSDITNKLLRIKIILDFFCQIVLIVMCGYNVYHNISNLVRLIIYSLLLVLSIFWLFYTISYYSKGKASKDEKYKKRQASITVRVLKICYRLVLITYSIIEISIFGYNSTSFILLIASVLTFILQVFLAVIINEINSYISNLEIAFEKDIAVFEKGKGIIDKIAHPLYSVSSKWVDEEPSTNDEKNTDELDEMVKRYQEKINGKEEIKKAEKEKLAQYRKQTVQRFKEKIKDKFNSKNKQN